MQILFYPVITWKDFCENADYHTSRLPPDYSGQQAFIPIREDNSENILCILINNLVYKELRIESDKKLYNGWQGAYSPADGELHSVDGFTELKKGIYQRQKNLSSERYVSAVMLWNKVDLGIEMRNKAMFLVFHPSFELPIPERGVIVRTVIEANNSFAMQGIDNR